MISTRYPHDIHTISTRYPHMENLHVLFNEPLFFASGYASHHYVRMLVLRSEPA